MAKGCLYIFGLIILIIVVANVANDCENEKKPKTHTYVNFNNETGKYDTITLVDGEEYTYNGNKPLPYDPDGGYYPTREEDSKCPDNHPTGLATKAWHEGYVDGEKDGEADYKDKEPYKTYNFTGMYQYNRGADYKLGYWQGYRSKYPGIKRITSQEVKEIEDTRFAKHLDPNPEPYVSHRSKAYDKGYHKGYNQGEEDAISDAGYECSYDDSNNYRGSSRKEYEEGYSAGYEDGYLENNDE